LPTNALGSTVLGGRFRVDEERRIGEGSYGTVVRVVEVATSRRFAAKLFLSDSVPSAHQERRVYEALAAKTHPAFHRIVDSAWREPMAWFVIPLGSGSLASYIRSHSIDSDAVAGIAEQVRDGLVHLHEVAGFLHLDVKPSNLLFCPRSMHVHIIDFGLCRPWPHNPQTLKNSVNGNAVCTSAYRAPELFASHVTIEDLSPAVDAWAVGVVLVEAATGKSLFWGADGQRDRAAQRVLSFARDYYSSATSDGPLAKVHRAPRPVARGLLHPDPRRRRCLRQPF